MYSGSRMKGLCWKRPQKITGTHLLASIDCLNSTIMERAPDWIHWIVCIFNLAFFFFSNQNDRDIFVKIYSPLLDCLNIQPWTCNFFPPTRTKIFPPIYSTMDCLYIPTMHVLAFFIFIFQPERKLSPLLHTIQRNFYEDINDIIAETKQIQSLCLCTPVLKKSKGSQSSQVTKSKKQKIGEKENKKERKEKVTKTMTEIHDRPGL